MLKSYEATYDKGRLEWIDEVPDIEDGEKILVIVEAPQSRAHRGEEIRKILDEARGAWGTGMSLEELDQKIKGVRFADWERNWKVQE